ncbi:excinuclease ABC subunit UvrA [Clostridium saccharoperbutylacetonicum]
MSFSNELKQEYYNGELNNKYNPYDNTIVIQGARQHNLKNISLTIPKNKLVIFTGVSGSGKSTLAFDTIYAEAQRRYMVGFSAFARRNLEKLEKPKFDFIYGLSPAIAIEQKGVGNNPRSTVGTITEISDYLRLLYSRVGIRHCLHCDSDIIPTTPRKISESIYKIIGEHKTIQLFSAIRVNTEENFMKDLENVELAGFYDVRIEGSIKKIKDIKKIDIKSEMYIEIVGPEFDIPKKSKCGKNDCIDKLVEIINRIIRIGNGTLTVECKDDKKLYFTTNSICPKCYYEFPKLTAQYFSFNTPVGMCHDCGGLGVKQEILPESLIGNEKLSILDGAIKWYGEIRDSNKTTWPTGPLDVIFNHYNVDIETPWCDLPEKVRNVILYGSGDEKLKYKSVLGNKETAKPVLGLIPELTRLYYKSDSDFSRKKYGSYMTSEPCKTCEGTKLCKEARYVTINGKTISEVGVMSVEDAIDWLEDACSKFNADIFKVSDEIISEINNRLSFLNKVGLNYISLNRSAPTLSGGEGQRVRLAGQLSSGIMGIIYVLDEPSVGLHPRDIKSLTNTLLTLRDQGNTVLVVEHDEAVMQYADWIIDIGPKAGELGGEVIAQGTMNDVINDKNSITGRYLSGKLVVGSNEWSKNTVDNCKWLVLKGAAHNNLKDVNVKFPLGRFTCVTGVSGSGKSSLIQATLEPLLEKLLNNAETKPGKYEEIIGYEYLDRIIDVSQDPIGRTPRSNPATYTGVFDQIRKVFASTEYAKDHGYKADHFSFNSKKGSCEVCSGEGQIKVEMHFLADIWITCNECNGKRFKPEILECKFNGKNIADVLDMNVKEALDFFKDNRDICRILETLCDVGLEYIKLGQSSVTLSGGEAQRIKLAKEISKKTKDRMIYILDEPTTGLHFSDIQHLLDIFKKLVDSGHTLIVIEHNIDVIKSADWIIDIGPEGGVKGGEIIAQTYPKDLIDIGESYTGAALKESLEWKSRQN